MSDLIKRDRDKEELQRYEPPEQRYVEEYDDSNDISASLIRARDFALKVVLAHKWLILAICFTIVVLAALQSYTTTPMYRATLQLHIEPDSANVLPYREITESGFSATDAYLQSQISIIRSQIMAARVVERMALYDNPSFSASTSPGLVREAVNSAMGFAVGTARGVLRAVIPREEREEEESERTSSPSTVDEHERRVARLVPRLRGGLDVQVVSRSRLLEIAFVSHDPVLAAQIVDAVAEEFIEYNFESKHQTTTTASDFLQRQLKEHQIRVEQSEEGLLRYARQHNILDYDQRENIVLQRLTELNRQITSGERRLSAARANYEAVQNASPNNFPQNLRNPTVRDLERRISQLEQRLATLRTQFDENWPAVVEAREEKAELEKQLRTEKEQAIQQAREEYQGLLSEQRHLVATLQDQKQIADRLNENLIQYRILQREAETNRQMYESLLQRSKEAGVSASLRPDNVRVLDRGGIPRSPFFPNPTRSLILALFMGVVLGGGLATLLTLLDNTVKTPDDLEYYVGLPSLGLIPTIRRVDKAGHRVTAVTDPVESQAFAAETAIIPYRDFAARSWEPYRALRTSILLSHSGSPPKTILVTSSLPSEGKSVTAVNTAIVLAQTGSKTVLVDLDMRRPRLGTIFGMNGKMGMSVYLSGNSEEISDLRSTPVPNLHLVTSGETPPNPAELIGSRRMQEALERLTEEFEYVVIDSPPVMSCTDAVVLSPMVDGVVLVARGGKTPRKALRSSAYRVWSVGGKILGVVINDVDLDKPEYSYHYGDYYQHYHYYNHKQS